MQNTTAPTTNNKKPINKIIKIVLFAAFLIASVTLILNESLSPVQDSKTPIQTKTLQIFSDSSGNPILAMGNCIENSDCMPTGCSSQICSDHSVTTTCELGEFPEKETYTCGCQNEKCVWFRYQ